MAVGDYGYHEINGKERAVDPDQPKIELPSDRNNTIGVNTYIYSTMERPMLKIIGGAKDDIFNGGSADIWGGRGADIFYNGGTEPDETYGRAAILKGQGGADIFYDTYGSTDYYGGQQRDIFTNARFMPHSNDGDIDRAFMGKGADQAEIRFADVVGPDGQNWEDRSLHVDGGKGFDHLFLGTDQVGLQLTTQSVLDFRMVNNGTMTLANASFTDFEKFTLNIGAVSVKELHGGRFDDHIEWLDSSDAREKDLTLYGHGGDDFIIGSYDATTDRIFGGKGDDIITGAGGQTSGWIDHLYGGTGDDMVFTGSKLIMGGGTAYMTGGRGADQFVVSHGSNIEYVTRILDFKQGVDKIGLDFTFGYVLNAENPRNAAKDIDETTYVIEKDDADALRFALEIETVFGTKETHEWSYLREIGVLRYYDSGTWEKVAVISDAPDLTLDDFSYFDWG